MTNSVFLLVHPMHSCYEMKKQFQRTYMTAKFKKFQRELLGKISCDLSSCKKGVDISKDEVAEDVMFEESRRCVTFNVCFHKDTSEVDCNCRLFEYRGILCRHQIVVFIHKKLNQIPDKYILRMWSKNVKISHTEVRISYDNGAMKSKACCFAKMCNAFYEVTELAEDSEDRYEKVMERMYELNISFKEGSCRSNEDISKVHQKNPTSCANGFGIPKESINILDPSKRRPPYKRKQSKVEKVIKKRKESKKKTHTTSNKENMHKQIDESVEKVVV
ncbi:protein FAR1-RELATED SEQUENCE 2-like [Camellia sinensis]|uniref:protein FAR1-RELATED SEQUENCE 2-like n=1 Tax=Camellia sinensis TaxID=4442 RepID=UPI001036C30A|nr:protein FAR1-RELATED SEQUENCE 2-like [Camellia sinensis]